jgi:hypothetical protein
MESVKTMYVLESAWIVLIACSFFSYRSYDASKHDPPYKLYSNVAEQILSNVGADSCELIIAHKSLAEYIVYSTGVDAMSWIPEYEIADSRLWRIAEGVKDVQFNFYLDSADVSFVHRLTPSYSLIREDCWQRFILNVRKDGNEEMLRDLTTWKNPSRLRPGFMRRNKER